MVSIIVPTLNAGPSFTKVLDQLQSQSVDCEIIVVDSSSGDGTPEEARGRGLRVETITRDQFHHARTRNLGARLAKGDILVFMTQDCVPLRNDCITVLTSPLTNPEVAASYGRQLPRQGARPTEVFARTFNYPEEVVVKSKETIRQLGIKTYFFSNVCSAVRRDVFRKVGGFPEDLSMFEDMRLAKKLIDAGYKIAYAPGAQVVHSHDLGLKEQFVRYYRAGYSLAGDPALLSEGKTTAEGRRFLREELQFLVQNGHAKWIPYAVAEAACKFVGFRLGILRDSAIGRKGHA